MKCFNHNGSDAVAACGRCGKGCCADCIFIDKPVIACSEDCATVIEENRQILERTKMIYGIGAYQRKQTLSTQVILFVVMGMLFSGFGGYQIITRSFEVGFFPFVMGIVFIIIGVIAWHRNRKIQLNC